MARQPRIDVGGIVYHVINRANNRAAMFYRDSDYLDFEYLLSEMKVTYGVPILAYVIMPNHWHLLLHPREDGDLGRAVGWLGTSHAVRHRVRTESVGGGHLYQGRFKSFPIQEDLHFLTVLKYIERNPVRAGLCEQACDWRWGSAFRRLRGTAKQRALLGEMPVHLPRNYARWINTPERSEDLDDVRRCVNVGMSYGNTSHPRIAYLSQYI